MGESCRIKKNWLVEKQKTKNYYTKGEEGIAGIKRTH